MSVRSDSPQRTVASADVSTTVPPTAQLLDPRALLTNAGVHTGAGKNPHSTHAGAGTGAGTGAGSGAGAGTGAGVDDDLQRPSRIKPEPRLNAPRSGAGAGRSFRARQHSYTRYVAACGRGGLGRNQMCTTVSCRHHRARVRGLGYAPRSLPPESVKGCRACVEPRRADTVVGTRLIDASNSECTPPYRSQNSNRKRRRVVCPPPTCPLVAPEIQFRARAQREDQLTCDH